MEIFYRKLSVARILLVATFLAYAGQSPGFELLDKSANGQAADPTVQYFDFRFPSMILVDHRGRDIELGRLFAGDENVVFAFFFTHCVSVCTTLTQTLMSLQPQLPLHSKIVMISIDPDTDTPELLSAYVTKHGIDDRNWLLLTGDNASIVELQKSFEAYRGNKMNHSVSLFLKKSGSDRITEIRRNFVTIPGLLARS